MPDRVGELRARRRLALRVAAHPAGHALGVAGAGLGTGAAAGLRALGSARRSLRCQLLPPPLRQGGLGGAAWPARSARPGVSHRRDHGGSAVWCSCSARPPCASAAGSHPRSEDAMTDRTPG